MSILIITNSYEINDIHWNHFQPNRLFFRLFRYNLAARVDAIAAKHFGPNLPSVTEMEQRTVLALVNTNPAMDFTRPLPENVIPVGGVHIRDPKPLPRVIVLILIGKHLFFRRKFDFVLLIFRI